jgi:hypothetical protein
MANKAQGFVGQTSLRVQSGRPSKGASRRRSAAAGTHAVAMAPTLSTLRRAALIHRMTTPAANAAECYTAQRNCLGQTEEIDAVPCVARPGLDSRRGGTRQSIGRLPGGQAGTMPGPNAVCDLT